MNIIKYTDYKFNLKVVFDRTKVNWENPGEDTPAMVYLFHKGEEVGSATYDYVLNEGEVMIYGNATEKVSGRLNGAQLNYLESLQPILEDFLFSK